MRLIKNKIMQIKPEHLEQLALEVQHIFDSGANEVRVYNMIQAFIENRGEALFLPIVIKPSYCDAKDCNDSEGMICNGYCKGLTETEPKQ